MRSLSSGGRLLLCCSLRVLPSFCFVRCKRGSGVVRFAHFHCWLFGVASAALAVFAPRAAAFCFVSCGRGSGGFLRV